MPLCGVFAAAFVLGKPVAEVMTMFRRKFLKGSRWQGRMSRRELHTLLRLLGVKWTEVGYMAQKRRCSLAKWVDWNTAKGGTYLVETGGHFQVVRDGIVYDQVQGVNGTPIDSFSMRRHRVKCALLIKNPKAA